MLVTDAESWLGVESLSQNLFTDEKNSIWLKILISNTTTKLFHVNAQKIYDPNVNFEQKKI